MSNSNIIVPIRIMFDMRAAKEQRMHLPDHMSMTLFLNKELRERAPEFTNSWLVVRDMRESFMNLLEIRAKIDLDTDGYTKRSVMYQALLQANLIHACHDAVGMQKGKRHVVGRPVGSCGRRMIFDDVC